MKEAVKTYIKHTWPYNNNNTYNIDMQNPQIYWTQGGLAVIRVVVQRTDEKIVFQEGTQIQQTNAYRAFHGTRQCLLKHILADGLKASIHSHGIVGTWANLDIDEALL